MKVMVIPEDFRKDQHILKPIIKAMMSALGKPKAKVQVCQEPLLGGVGEALKWQRIEEILLFYWGMIDLYLLIVDRDGKAGRRQRLNELEQLAAEYLPSRRGFLAENAWQEVEVSRSGWLGINCPQNGHGKIFGPNSIPKSSILTLLSNNAALIRSRVM